MTSLERAAVPSLSPRRRRGRLGLRLLTAAVCATTAAGVVVAGPATSRPESSAPVAGAPGSSVPTGSVRTTEPVLRLAVATSHRWPGHPGRRLVRYRVRPGDTATGLAVRFHAWTRELRALNHLGRRGTLYVGEHVRIPVVVAATRHHARPRARHHTHHARHHARHHAHHHAHHAHHHARRAHHAHHAGHHARHPWRHADATRAGVRRVIVRTARRHGVEPATALAIAWQESGWQQRRISSAGAVGAMQVMPGTGRWMSTYVDRRLNLYGLHDNVTAGVVLFRVLRGQASWRHSIAAYYQGLGAVQEHGLYPETRHYTRNVRALYHRLHHGWNPARS